MNDTRLAELLHDAVADVEPADRILEIRARTAESARSAARPWLYAAGATVLATAAAVTAFAVLGNDSSPDSGPVHEGHEEQTFLIPAYFIGDTPAGPRLYREFDEVQGHDELEAALARIARPAADPDYRTAWGADSFESVTVGDGSIDVEVDHWMAEPDALALQQVVYTLQGTLQSRLPVRFLDQGEPFNTVDALPQLDVLSLVSISDPAEGTAYTTDEFVARGRASSYEANVPWEVQNEAGEAVVTGFATADGYMDKLYRWETRVDISDLPSGFYTFVAMTDDPSAGAEGAVVYTDTRQIIVR